MKVSDSQRCRAVMTYGGRGFAGRCQGRKTKAGDLCPKHQAVEATGASVKRMEDRG